MGTRQGLAIGAVMLTACSFSPSGLSVPSLGDDDDVPIDAAAIDGISIDGMPGCTDTDGDTVCDADDDCPGHDDRQNLDGDDTPDGCDNWNCGPTRPSVSLPVAIADGLTISQVSINGGGAVEELDRNSNAVLAVKFTFVDGNSREQDQIEIGVADGNRLNCRRPSDQLGGWTVPPFGFNTGGSHRQVSLTAQVAHESSCNSGDRENGWAGDAPSEPIIGVICVR